MNQYIKSFEEFKEIYTSQEFEEILKEANVIKKRTKSISIKYMIALTISFIIGFIIFMMLGNPLLRWMLSYDSWSFNCGGKKQRKS